MRVVRACEVSRGIGSSVFWKLRRGKKCRYGSGLLNSAFARDGTSRRRRIY
jgi:hypothetical protein